MEKKPRFHFTLWRLLAAIVCFGLAFTLVRVAVHEVREFGGGVFPILCVILATLLFVAAIGCFFNRAVEFVVRAARLIAEWFTLA